MSKPKRINGIIAKKYLGQNFLIDQKVITRIVDSCLLNESETVLEIGPGQGALTQHLLPRIQNLIAVETDPFLAQTIQNKFTGQNIKICQADFTKINLNSFNSSLKIVGNIPYNISTPILLKIIESRNLIVSAHITIQLEFGERLIAQPGSKNYSSLSCFVQMFTDTKIAFRISPQAFRPIPKVTSCFLYMTMRKAPLYPVTDEILFMRIVRQAFAFRRKNLLNAFLSLYPSKKFKVENFLKDAGIDPNSRAEDITIEQYARMTNVYAKDLLL